MADPNKRLDDFEQEFEAFKKEVVEAEKLLLQLSKMHRQELQSQAISIGEVKLKQDRTNLDIGSLREGFDSMSQQLNRIENKINQLLDK